MSEKDGGNAFPFTPVPQPQNQDGTWCQQWDSGSPGMTLRDYFAAKAMQALIHDSEIVADDGAETREMLAVDAYAIADAMLVERDKVTQTPAPAGKE